MAEGGDLKPFTELTQKMCEVCVDEVNLQNAPWFCKQCRQRLCDKCKKYHGKLSSTKSHEIIETREAPTPKLASTADASDELRPPMCQKHKMPLEKYCEDHGAPLCGSCKLVDHRKCDSLRDLDDVVSENSGIFENVLEYMQAINGNMEEVRLAMEKEKHCLKLQKDEIIERIKNKMKELEILGQKKVSEVESTFKEESKSLEREKEIVTHSKLLISSTLKDLDTASETASPCEKFLSAKRASKEAEKYQEILNDISIVSHREIEFTLNQVVDIDSVGNVTLRTKSNRVDHQPQVINDLTIDDNDDDKSVTWLNVLANGQMVLLLRKNNALESQLRLYNASRTLLSSIVIPLAGSADMLSDQQIILPIFNSRALQLVNIFKDKLVRGNVIKTNLSYGLLVKTSEQSVLAVGMGRSKNCLCHVMDLTGHIVSNKSLSTVTEEMPVRLNMSENLKIVHLVYVNDGCFRFDEKGELVFQYKHQDCNHYAGLAVDSNGYIYTTCGLPKQRKCFIIQLSPTGEYIKQVLQSTDAWIYPVTCIGHRLIVAKREKFGQWKIAHLYIT